MDRNEWTEDERHSIDGTILNSKGKHQVADPVNREETGLCQIPWSDARQ